MGSYMRMQIQWLWLFLVEFTPFMFKYGGMEGWGVQVGGKLAVKVAYTIWEVYVIGVWFLEWPLLCKMDFTSKEASGGR